MTFILEKIHAFQKDYGKLLHNGGFMRLISAGVISAIGTKISYFALLRKVYELSGGNITDLGFMTICAMIPTLLLGAFAGVLIDRFSRKKIMIISDVFSGLTILAAILATDLWMIYFIAFLSATVNVFRQPAQSAFEPNLVSKEDIPLMNAFKSSTFSLVQVVGSAAGAAVVGFIGANKAFIVDAVTFWASALLIATVVISENHQKEGQAKNGFASQLQEFKDGISIMWTHPKVKLMILIETFLTFAMSMQGVLFYMFIRETLQMGDRSELVWGTMLSFLGIGSIVGSFLIGSMVKKHANPFALFLNVLLFDAITLAGIVFSRFMPVTYGMMAMLGCIGAAHMIILNSALQKAVPDENRGKVFSAMGMLLGPIGVLSVLVGTTAADYLSAPTVLLIAALIEALISIGIRFTATFRMVELESDFVAN